MKNKSLKKKIIVLAMSLSVSVCAVTMPAIAGWEQIGCMGDLNNDGNTNIADLLLMSKFILGTEKLSSENAYDVSGKYYSINGSDADNSLDYLQTADINQDGRVDIFDLVIMRQYVIWQWGDPVYVWNDDTEETSSTTATQTTTTTTKTTSSETTTTTTAKADFIEAPVKNLYGSMPSQNNAEMVVFYVDFPDCAYTYEPTIAEIEKYTFGGEDAESKSYPFESMAAFYNRASKGNLKINGKVFRYTAKENKSAYENDIYHVKLINEVYQAFEESEDFTKFDANGDKIIDATLISVPTEAGDENWWPAAGQYGGSSNFKVDGMSPGHVIVGNAQIDGKTDYRNFTGSYLHEIGHCMGLPDYYLYTDSKDFEGLHGSAGFEMMDDTNADFSAVSKLMLGWYKKEQIEIYNPADKTKTYTLNNAQKDNGNCIIIPCGKMEDNYYSEFLIVEYATLDRNNSRLRKDYWWKNTGSGVRVFHVEGTITDSAGWKYWKYASGNNDDTNNDNGKRFIRLIDDTDTDNLYYSGNIIDGNISGFKWYAEDGTQSVDVGLKITIGESTDDNCTITVSEK